MDNNTLEYSDYSENLTEFGNSEIDELDCPVYHENSDDWIDFFNFWIGGVLQTGIAIPGFLGKSIDIRIHSFLKHY